MVSDKKKKVILLPIKVCISAPAPSHWQTSRETNASEQHLKIMLFIWRHTNATSGYHIGGQNISTHIDVGYTNTPLLF